MLVLMCVSAGAAEARASDSKDSLEKDFRRVADLVRLVVQLRSDAFPEVSLDRFGRSPDWPGIAWQETEHDDLECRDERRDASEPRRPFCLRADGRTVVVSSTYFASTAADSKERLALVAGVLLLADDPQASANRAIALRVAEVAAEEGIGANDDASEAYREIFPNGKTVRHIAIHFGSAARGENDAVAAHAAGAGGELHLAKFSRNGFHWTAMPNLMMAVRAHFGTTQGGRFLYNVDGSFQLSSHPLFLGLWLAVKANGFETAREMLLSVGVPLLALPFKLGREDYVLVKVNAGWVPVSNLQGPGGRKLFLRGLNLNAEVMYRTGAFFVALQGERSYLRNHDPEAGDLPTRFQRTELTALAGVMFPFVTDQDAVSLEGRYNRLGTQGPEVPGIDYHVQSIGVRYDFSWR